MTYPEDPLAPARGILVGLLLSLTAWLVVGIVVMRVVGA